MNLLKDLLLTSLLKKAEKIDWEELGSNATFLPLIYFLVMAPGVFFLFGLCCFITAAMGEQPEVFIRLGACFISCSMILILTYRIVIKRQFKFRKHTEERKLKESTEKPLTLMDGFLAPFLVQIKREQEMLLRKDE